MFEIVKPGTNIDFVRQSKYFLVISTLAVIASVVLLFTKGLNYGIDFTGGAEVQIQVPTDWDTAQVRSTLSEGGLEGARVQQIGEPGTGTYLIRVAGEEDALNQVAESVRKTFASVLDENQFTIERVDVVGPAAGSALRMAGYLSMLYALISILIYVTIRFDFRFSPGVVIPLFHDAITVIGIFIVMDLQFDLQILAAILALIGYSCNDTIVTFDRVREILQLHPKMPMKDVVNRAVNDTLSRTLLTSITTFLVVGALWLFGGSVIHDFAFALMVGVVIGTYSTIYVATAILIFFSNLQDKRETKKNSQGERKRRTYQVRPEPKFQ